MSLDEPSTVSASGSMERNLIQSARRQAAGAAPVTLPSDSFPGYQIVRELHRGGQGVVYLATQKSTGQKVAIKVIRQGSFASLHDKARFDREVHILATLEHPNIVTIHDSGEAAGLFYIVMDYIPGQPLDSFTASRGRDVGQSLEFFHKICEAVNAAHLRGVIHRDLKPSNIRIDPEGEPHILDFGLAKLSTDQHPASTVTMTATGQFVGSLPWASPEQAEGLPDKIDLRTDVYSLGVILYQMLTGRLPYEVSGGMRQALDTILKAEPARPSTIRRQIDDEVETIILKCLNKEPARRYQSAGELARDIERYLAGEPIQAKGDSGWYVLRKTLRRYRVHARMAAVALLLVLGLAGTSLYLYFATAGRVDSAEHRARLESRHRELAEDARITAERLAASSQAAQQFLRQLLLSSLPPAGADPHQIQAALSLLDETAARVDAELSDDPQAAAAAHQVLALSYQRLGATEQAQVQFRAAEALLLQKRDQLQKTYSPSSAPIRAVREQLAELYDAWGRPAEATATRSATF